MVTAMTVLVGVASAGVILYSLLGESERWDIDAGAGRLGRLQRRRGRLLRRIKDLEFEREAGTLSEAEFSALRDSLKREAVEVTKQLERVRRQRLHAVSSGSRVHTPANAIRRVESAIAARKAQMGAVAVALALFVASSGSLEAGVTLGFRVFDAEASYPALRAAVTRASTDADFEKAFSDEIKVAFASKDVVVEMVRVRSDDRARRGEIIRSWPAKTDAEGRISVETGLEALPPDASFVVSATDRGGRIFSPYVSGQGGETSVLLYRTSDRSDAMRVATFAVTYDYTRRDEQSFLRVQVDLRFAYADYTMYVGNSRGGDRRELFRVPLPEGATVVENRGPTSAYGGWVVSDDGRSAVVDDPVPGFFDSLRDMAGMHWRLGYEIPARQSLSQSFRVPVAFAPQKFTAWCVHEDMDIASAQIDKHTTFQHPDAPIHRDRAFEVFFSQETLEPGSIVNLHLDVNNAPIRQVRWSSVRWVAAFVITFLVATLLGLAAGRKNVSVDALFGDLSGEEILDRIVDLDRRYEAKSIREAEYRAHREALVALAAEELGTGAEAESLAPSARAKAGSAPDPALAKVRELVSRIDKLDAEERTDSETLRERSQLLEALLKAVPREDGKS